MAQQTHHDSLSQHISQCSCSNDETQRHDPEPKHNSETASQHVTKHHDQQNQWNKQHQLNSSSTMNCIVYVMRFVFTPEQEVTGEIPRAQSCITNEISSLTRMAQQHYVMRYMHSSSARR